MKRREFVGVAVGAVTVGTAWHLREEKPDPYVIEDVALSGKTVYGTIRTRGNTELKDVGIKVEVIDFEGDHLEKDFTTIEHIGPDDEYEVSSTFRYTDYMDMMKGNIDVTSYTEV